MSHSKFFTGELYQRMSDDLHLAGMSERTHEGYLRAVRQLACSESSVTFRFTPSGTKRSKTRTVTGQEFVRGFLQHTLPRGFQKIRYYGWMSPNSRIKRDEVKWLVWLFLGWTYWLASGHAPQPSPAKPPIARCAECGGMMHVVEVTFDACRTLPEHALAYLDSG
jgi:hypothetical protein